MGIKSFLQWIFSVKNVEKHKQVEILGIKMNFKNKRRWINEPYLYEEHRRPGRNARLLEENSVDMTGLVSYHILNKIKEIELKKKVQNNKKVKVAFFLDSITKFSALNVYKQMLNHKLFEPFIVLYNTFEVKFDEENFYEDYKQEYNELVKQGYKVYPGYDDNKNYIPIETYKPDIVFFNAYYLDIIETTRLSNTFLNINYLVCEMNYGLNTVNHYYYHYNNRRINTAWKYFVDTREDYTEMMRYSRHFGVNTVLTGYPRLDDYATSSEENTIFSPPPASAISPIDKFKNNNPIVIYAPHWSVKTGYRLINIATFHLYHKYFLDMVKKHRDINFVFKPHPSLENRLIDTKTMTSEEYKNYIQEWDSQPNGLYVFDGEYIDLFKKSSLLITDSGSFIGEYLPSGHPCIYLVNPEFSRKIFMHRFSNMGKKILETYYLAYNEKDIDKYFNMLMFEKTDPNEQLRLKLKDELFINIGCASKKIVEYLENILTE